MVTFKHLTEAEARTLTQAVTDRGTAGLRG
jgi:hypothetical protein